MLSQEVEERDEDDSEKDNDDGDSDYAASGKKKKRGKTWNMLLQCVKSLDLSHGDRFFMPLF